MTLPGLPWSEGFMRAHAAALIGGKPDSPPDDLGAARQPAQMIIPKSMAALIRDFKRSRFPELGAVTQANYTRLLAKLELAAGHLPVAGIRPEDIQRLVNERASEGGVEAGSSTRRMFRALMTTAKELNYRRDNPALDIKKKRAPKGAKKGWDTLSEDNITKFYAKWARGTHQHMAMTLLLWTGQRRGDAVRIAPASVVGGYDPGKLQGRTIFVRQNKTGKELDIPLAPALADALTACGVTAAAPAFIMTSRGKAYSDKSFTGKFTAWGRAAGITTQCSPHTLRFAAARRLAELGLSLKVIASITGHDSLKELERYTKAADQRGLAEQAMTALATRHPTD